MMKILIISHYFPPQNSIASLRPYSWAKYWAQAGHNVTVLTTTKIAKPVDSSMPFDGFDVIEVPIPGMHRITKMMGGGDSVAQDVASKTQPSSTAVQSFSMKRLVKQVLNSLQTRYGVAVFCRMPDPLDFWCGAALKALGNQSWDLVVSTAWPYGVHRPAYALKRQGLAKYWIADWRDLWVDNHMFPGLPGFRTIERHLERRWCNAADAITTVSEPLADTLRVQYGDKVHVIYNGFDPDDYALLPAERAFPDDGVFRIVYTGSIYAGQQDPTPLFRALFRAVAEHDLKPANLQVLFCGNNSNVNDLAQREGVADFVQYVGFLPRPKALHMQRDATALLLLEFESKTVKGILTGKLFEYLFAGPPVWAVGLGSDSAIADVLIKTNRGFVLGKDIDLILSKILELSLLPKIKNMIPNKFISEYSRKTQAQLLLGVVSDLH